MIFGDWIRSVIQPVELYFTPNHIANGTLWSDEIAAKQLSDSKVVIFILTAENLTAPWIIFEAGAISQQLDSTLVHLLLCGVSAADVRGPLKHFQYSAFSKYAVRDLLERIDSTRKNSALAAAVLERVFDRRWLELETEVTIALSEGTEDTGAAKYPVWFGTNRQPSDLADPSKGYTGERDQTIRFGRVDVIVPKAHRFGETGSSFFARLRRFDFRDDQLSVDKITPLEAEAMWAEIQSEMNRATSLGDAACGLLFLHGYNTSFADAAIRAAQIGFDLKVTGSTAFFSWPSLGMKSAYPADEATIEASEAAIADFIVAFAKCSEAGKVHLIAHSMGNRGLLRALQRIANNAETKGAVKFGQIFLAAPDVDRELFLNLANLYPPFAGRTTLYESSADRAVYLSSRFHQAPRAGYFLPYTVAPGIDTIAVPDFNVDLLGHSYFAEAEALLYDMQELMQTNTPPRSRQRIEELHSGSDHLCNSVAEQTHDFHGRRSVACLVQLPLLVKRTRIPISETQSAIHRARTMKRFP
jgi:esterase/lipase superfamily enzyme